MSERYDGSWGSAYAELHRRGLEKYGKPSQQESEELRLREEVSRLTMQNVKLTNENNDLFCENGRLIRAIEKMKLSE